MSYSVPKFAALDQLRHHHATISSNFRFNIMASILDAKLALSMLCGTESVRPSVASTYLSADRKYSIE